MSGLCKSQNKLKYPSKVAAIRAAMAYSKKRGVPLRTYFHAECRSFHLTHTAKKV